MLYKVEKLSLRLIYSQIDKGGKVIYRLRQLQSQLLLQCQISLGLRYNSSMKRLALYFVGLVCILCNCTAQTVSSSAKDNSQQNQNKQLQQNVKGQKSTPTYSIISVENTYKLRWTGKAFTGLHKDKANTWLIKAVVKGLDAKWLKHPFSITTKDVWLLKDSLQKDVVAIVALESAETGWSFPVINKEYFMIEECEAPLYAVPYFINGRVYIICLTPSFQIKGDEMYPAIDRKELQEKVLMPLMQSFK